MPKIPTVVEGVDKVAESSSMSDPNLGEDSGDVLSRVALESEGDSGLVGVVADLVGSRWSPLAELPRAGDVGSVQRVVEGRTLVRETILSSGVSEPFTGSDTGEGEHAPHRPQTDGASALKVALQVKAVRAIVLGLVAVGTLFQLSHGV